MRIKSTLTLCGLIISFCVSSQNFAYQWGKAFNGTFLTGFYKTVKAANSDLIIAGGFRETADVDFSADGVQEFTVTVGVHNPCIIRTTYDGDFIWGIHIKGQVFVNELLLDADDNIYIAGDFEGTVDFDPGDNTLEAVSQGAHDSYVAKYSSTGALVWAKFFGGFQQQVTTAMVMDDAGDLIFTGYFEYTVDFDPSDGVSELTPLVNDVSVDVFIVKWTGDGAFVWAKQLGGVGSQLPYDMTRDGEQNILITGTITDTMDCDPGINENLMTPVGTGFTAFVVKLNHDAELIWAQQYGDGSQDQGVAIETDSENNIYHTGRFDGTADFEVGAGTAEVTAFGNRDVFISKLQPDGTFLWVSSLGGADTDHPTDMDVDADGNVYVCGLFQTTCDFDPSDGVQNISVYGDFDGFISVLNTDGEYLWATRQGNNSYNAGISIMVDDGYIFSMGVFAYGCFLDPENDDVNSVVATGDSEGFIAKYAHPAIGDNVGETISINAEIYPNPASDFISIKGISSHATIILSDITGKIVLNESVMRDRTLDISSIEAGIYVLHIEENGMRVTKKVAVE